MRTSKLIGIDALLTVDGAAEVTTKDTAQTITSIGLETVLPKSAKPCSEYWFLAPAGVICEQFVFEFTSMERLLVIFGQVQEQLELEYLKMNNQNSSKLTSLWVLLRSLAITDGSISWQDEDADDRLKK
tara:strand:- start:830 stop:1216 length:387 start_codon:yes stop_codon:yes gene_type:complete